MLANYLNQNVKVFISKLCDNLFTTTTNTTSTFVSATVNPVATTTIITSTSPDNIVFRQHIVEA